MTGLWYDRHPGGRNIWDQHPLEQIELFHLVVFARQDEGGDADIEYRAGEIFEHAFLWPSIFSRHRALERVFNDLFPNLGRKRDSGEDILDQEFHRFPVFITLEADIPGSISAASQSLMCLRPVYFPR